MSAQTDQYLDSRGFSQSQNMTSDQRVYLGIRDTTGRFLSPTEACVSRGGSHNDAVHALLETKDRKGAREIIAARASLAPLTKNGETEHGQVNFGYLGGGPTNLASAFAKEFFENRPPQGPVHVTVPVGQPRDPQMARGLLQTFGRAFLPRDRKPGQANSPLAESLKERGFQDQGNYWTAYGKVRGDQEPRGGHDAALVTAVIAEDIRRDIADMCRNPGPDAKPISDLLSNNLIPLRPARGTRSFSATEIRDALTDISHLSAAEAQQIANDTAQKMQAKMAQWHGLAGGGNLPTPPSPQHPNISHGPAPSP